MQRATNHATNRTVGVREAARALGKSPSTISRYLKEFPDLNLGSRTRPKIDVDVLRRHREANVNPFRSGSSAGRVFGEVDGTANGHADIPLADAYNAAYNAGKVLQQDLIDLAALLGVQLAATADPVEIVTLLNNDYLRILAELSASLRECTDEAPLGEGAEQP